MASKSTRITLDVALADEALYALEPDGPSPSRIAFVGEAPAKEEVKKRRYFVGPSGEILWQWAWKYMLIQRGEVWVDNLFPFPMPDKKGKDVDELLDSEVIEEYGVRLRSRLEEVGPEYVVTLGRWSTRALLGNDVAMEWCHGIGWVPPSERWTVVPCYHPAAGLHSPDRLQFTALDLQAANRIIRGEEKPRPLELVDDTEIVMPPYAAPAREIAIDTEGFPYSIQGSIREKEAFIILASDTVGVAQFKDWLERNKPLVILHNAPHDLWVLRMVRIDLIAMGLKLYDTLSAAHVLQDLPRGLKPLTMRLLGTRMQDFDDVVGPEWERTMKEWLCKAAEHEWPKPPGRCKPIPSRIQTFAKKEGEDFRKAWANWEIRSKVVGTVGAPPEVDYSKVEGFKLYACRDADVTKRCKRILQERIEAAGLEEVIELDNAVLPFIDQIKRRGLWCDIDKLIEFHAEVQERREQAIWLVRAIVGDPDFNPGSADQVEERLRPYLTKLAAEGRCRLTKTKKRFQVDDGVLNQIKDDDPLVPAVLEYRELDKLDGSYLTPLYKQLVMMRDENGEMGFWLPLDIFHAGVVSGRLSGRILTWPARTADGLRLRKCFHAPAGWKLASWDLSQIEMRLAAGFSGDRVMLRAFEDGVDLHVRTAASLFGVSEAVVEEDKARAKAAKQPDTMRGPTKTISYLVLYGGGEEKMFLELKTMKVPGFDRDRCGKLIAGWGGLYSGVIDFMRASAHEARIKGYVEVPFTGRRRYLPAASLEGNRWPCAKLREEAGRQAGNFKIQGGAQDLLKRAEVRVMNEVRPDLASMGVEFEPCLQMHDEIVALVREEHWEVTNALMVAAMTADEEMVGVRLECEGTMSDNWGGLK